MKRLIKTYWCLPFVVTTLISYSAWASSSDELDQAEAQTLVQRGVILPLSGILDLHQDRLAGELLDVELEREHSHIIYELEVLGTDGIVREYEIDATDGKILDVDEEGRPNPTRQ